MISICVPTHDMENGEFFLKRLIDSLDRQTYRNFELVITKSGKMAANTNSAIKKAKGDIIKILFMDDYLYSPDALQNIADNFTGGWLATGCVHDDGIRIANPHYPSWNDEVPLGKNTIGSPSVVAWENGPFQMLFDENLSWLLDAELYGRMHAVWGEPKLLPYLDIGIGIGTHQTTNLMSDKEKQEEFMYITNKHG